MQVGTIKKDLHCTAGIFQNHLFKLFRLLAHNSICLFFEKHIFVYLTLTSLMYSSYA